MTDKPQQDSDRRKPWVALVAFLSLSVFMYVSIAYKIIKYGP